MPHLSRELNYLCWRGNQFEEDLRETLWRVSVRHTGMPLRVHGSGEAVWAFLHSSVWWDVTVKKRRVSPNSKTRFRWIQESSAQKNVPPFGLDGVYISEPCPSYCSGHGDCISGVCFCDLGYTGKANMCPWQFACESSFAHRQRILGLLLSVSKNSSTWPPKYLSCCVFCSFKPPRKKTC